LRSVNECIADNSTHLQMVRKDNGTAVSILFWGAFFIEHIIEWFVRPEGEYPPAFVWVGMVFHFVMILG